MTNYSKRSFKPILTILGISLIITIAFIITQKTLSPERVGINEVTSSGSVIISLSPSNIMVRPKIEKSFDVLVDSANDKLTTVQLDLTYDPAMITILEVKSTGYLPVTLSEPTFANGVIKGTFAVEVSSGGKQGSGSIATIKYKVNQPGQFTIGFGADTLATTTSSETNMLKQVINTTVKALHPGDINGDDKVNGADYNIFLPAYGANTPDLPLVDLNSNGKVDGLDYNILVTNYGKTY